MALAGCAASVRLLVRPICRRNGRGCPVASAKQSRSGLLEGSLWRVFLEGLSGGFPRGHLRRGHHPQQHVLPLAVLSLLPPVDPQPPTSRPSSTAKVLSVQTIGYVGVLQQPCGGATAPQMVARGPTWRPKALSSTHVTIAPIIALFAHVVGGAARTTVGRCTLFPLQPTPKLFVACGMRARRDSRD